MLQELATPSWFDTEFLHQIIQEGKFSSEIEIIDFKLLPVNPGNNFCSTIYQINVDFKNNEEIKKKYFIVKSLLEEGKLKSITEEGKFMEKECTLYKEFFPLVNDLSGNIKISPKYFPSKLNTGIVLEDLGVEGYVMCNKFDQLDFEHSAMVMKSLATFHAMSMAVFKKNPALKSLGEANLFKNVDSYSFIFMRECLLRFGQEVEKWEGFEHFGNKIMCVYDTCYDRYCKISTNKNCFTVLNHGDLWVNNVLFKYGKNKTIEDVKLIDFQISMCGSLGIDIQYFTWTSIDKDVRSFRMDELYTTYMQTLNVCLENFGCDERITEEMLKKEIHLSMFYGFFAVFCSLNVILSENGKTNSFDNSCYRATVKQILVYLDNNGFF